jgi:hypothetical protein
MLLTPEQKAALAVWYQAKLDADAAKHVLEHEQRLRRELHAALGLSTDEGSHAEELPEGWKLKHKLPYVRDVDPRLLPSLRAPLEALGVALDTLIEWKPKLKLDAYRELTAEARAVLDTCITTTTGLPTVELVPPKDHYGVLHATSLPTVGRKPND